MDKYLSKKEYLNKYDSNVGYALYVENNIKRDDYVKLNTGKIVRVIGIKENKLNKKAIYFGVYEQDWFDSMAVENFSDNIIDLIEVGDIVHIKDVLHEDITYIWSEDYLKALKEDIQNGIKLVSILTKEQMASIEYKVEEDKLYGVKRINR